jgi:ribosome-binding protein aMBF1 (putative translation factor)
MAKRAKHKPDKSRVGTSRAGIGRPRALAPKYRSPLHATFCERLLAARLAAGLTQKQAAQRAKIAVIMWCFYETGRRQPSLGALERLAAAVECEPADLLR